MKWQTKVRKGVKRNSSRVKHFLKGVEKNLGGLTPLTPPENPPMLIRHISFVLETNLNASTRSKSLKF